MDKDLFVSIIVPVKNEEKHIAKCINALLELSYKKDFYEIIIVDNGSTDGTLQIIQKYNNIPQIKILKKMDGTISSIRNYGAKFAKGKIFAFLDGDCVPDSKWLTKGVGFLKNDKTLASVGFKAEEPGLETSWIERAWAKISSSSKHTGDKLVEWLPSFNLIIWKNIFVDVGCFDESLVTCEDADLGYRIGKKNGQLFSDSISVRHLGNVKTLVEFYLKERWRGKSNLMGFIKSANKSHDFPSVFIPICYVILSILFFLSWPLNILFPDIGLYGGCLGVLMVTVPIFLTLIKASQINNIACFFQVSFLFAVYLIARGSVIFNPWGLN